MRVFCVFASFDEMVEEVSTEANTAMNIFI